VDSVLIVGSQDKKLVTFLSKLGYELVDGGSGAGLTQVLGKTMVDLVLLDSRLEIDSLQLCEFLKSHEATKGVPIVCLSKSPELSSQLEALGLSTLECLPIPYSVGTVTSRIATQLRLRKQSGAQNPNASLAEMNAALRDVNEHLKREREQARGIQRGLLPKELPADARYQISICYRPLEEVGGDWYFIQQHKDGKVSIQIADVTGHGLSAAFIGSMTKLAINAANTFEPGELLKGVNRLMSPVLPEGKFITMEAILFDPTTGALKTARAGHPPVLVLHRQGGDVEELKADGYAVGFFDEGDFPVAAALLDHEDTLVLLTDGLSEGQNRGLETYGLTRPAQALIKSPKQASAAEISQWLLADFDGFRDGRILKDDLTLLVLKRT
jgi:serine phosphatase RsbU (regulator of sigma subunit)